MPIQSDQQSEPCGFREEGTYPLAKATVHWRGAQIRFLLLGVSSMDLEDGRGRSHFKSSSSTGHSVHILVLGNNLVFQNARLVLLNETHRKKKSMVAWKGVCFLLKCTWERLGVEA